MSSSNPYRKGKVSVQVWIEKKTHMGVKTRLAREGKYMNELITKFLRWYGGTEDDQDEARPEETPKTG